MDSSRVFVKGLPPNFTPEEFHQHFSKRNVVTDAKLFPRRRIGYVGYRNADDAIQAIKYYNKSFIRMSKITVELARSIKDQYATIANATTQDRGKRDLSNNPQLDPKGNEPKKQKLDPLISSPNSGDSKLLEFLEVMQPSSKIKVWANDDSQKAQPAALPVLQTLEISAHEDGKKLGGTQVMVSGNTNILDEPSPSPLENSAIGDHVVNQKLESVPNTQVSDEEWLRSRTSNISDLADASNLDGRPSDLKPIQEVSEGKTALPNDSFTGENSNLVVQPTEMAGSPHLESNVTPRLNDDTGEGFIRLFVRNMSYLTSEDDLRLHFSIEGRDSPEEVHISRDSQSGNSKGFAFVQYADSETANLAIQMLDGKPFQGRLLHIIPAISKKHPGLDEFALSKLPLKKQQQIKKRVEASSSTYNWNSMYMNVDAVMSSVADRLRVSKSDLLDPTSSDAAVKQAHAETHIIQEAKAYFASNGVNLDAFKIIEKSDRAILVKNFAYGTRAEELRSLFDGYGNVLRTLLPPSGTIAIIEFEHAEDARSALRSLAYRKFKDSILFLEKAPKSIFTGSGSPKTQTFSQMPAPEEKKFSKSNLIEDQDNQESAGSSTLFVRNLNFITTTDRLREVCEPLDGFASAIVKTRPDPKKPGQFLSMGYGFLEFRSRKEAQIALAAMDGYELDGHRLVIKSSHKTIDAAEDRRNLDKAKKSTGRKTKIIIKNLPFEASKKNIRALFGSYGQLRSVRVPKKFDNSTRGFAFADFLTAREAENAMHALKDTHLLGRRLVLEFSTEDAADPEKEIEEMQKKVGGQANKVALQSLVGPGRRKLNFGENEELLADDSKEVFILTRG